MRFAGLGRPLRTVAKCCGVRLSICPGAAVPSYAIQSCQARLTTTDPRLGGRPCVYNFGMITDLEFGCFLPLLFPRVPAHFQRNCDSVLAVWPFHLPGSSLNFPTSGLPVVFLRPMQQFYVYRLFLTPPFSHVCRQSLFSTSRDSVVLQ